LTKHGTHWINSIILTFISEIIDTLDAYVKFEVNLFHLTLKKRGNLRQVTGFMKKNVDLGFRSEPLCFKWGTPTCLDPTINNHAEFYFSLSNPI